VMGEAILAVPRLEIPSQEYAIPLNEVARCEAVRLFSHRAMAVQPQFRLTKHNAQAVLQICSQWMESHWHRIGTRKTPKMAIRFPSFF
jgi:predicted ATPase